MELEVHPTRLAVCRLEPGLPVPRWVPEEAAPLMSVTRTRDELSIVAPQEVVPEDVTAERGWRALSVRGPLEFSMTGVLASLSGALAEAGVPIFVVSTYDTDWLLVRGGDLGRAVDVLRAAGHHVPGCAGGSATLR